MVEIHKYRDAHGFIPFDHWLSGVRDYRARMRIKIRIDRLSLGLEGDWKPVGDGVRELRIPEGKGYRVYYAWDGDSVVLLLFGGNKASQQKDIEAAKHYWRDYHHG